MGRDGWLGVGWPVEYGGQGRTAIEQLIWFEEARRAGAPIPFVTLNTVGPTLMAAGSEAQKQKFLRGILAGEIHFAIGYSEPDAGTDLASLETSAVRDGDHYVVNGTKIFTSGADAADYVWLAVRTDPDAPKHKGISILIVDTKLPGFSHAPIYTVGGGHTNMTYYENVRVPVDMRGGPGEHGLAPDHDAAQPRADRARRVQQLCAAALRRHGRVGAQDRGRGRPAASATSRGCSRASARPTRGSRR